jgi:hypothetical protein
METHTPYDGTVTYTLHCVSVRDPSTHGNASCAGRLGDPIGCRTHVVATLRYASLLRTCPTCLYGFACTIVHLISPTRDYRPDSRHSQSLWDTDTPWHPSDNATQGLRYPQDVPPHGGSRQSRMLNMLPASRSHAMFHICLTPLRYPVLRLMCAPSFGRMREHYTFTVHPSSPSARTPSPPLFINLRPATRSNNLDPTRSYSLRKVVLRTVPHADSLEHDTNPPDPSTLGS